MKDEVGEGTTSDVSDALAIRRCTIPVALCAGRSSRHPGTGPIFSAPLALSFIAAEEAAVPLLFTCPSLCHSHSHSPHLRSCYIRPTSTNPANLQNLR
jgi:hypothetical protein